jgi:hypothetical protein
MTKKISRRTVLATMGAAGAASLVPPESSRAETANTPPPPPTGEILPFTSTTGVLMPTPGRGFMKFSFDFPEPSVAYEGYQFGFRINTYENVYALDGAQMTIDMKGDALEIACAQLLWAGGQQTAPGKLVARFRKNGPHIEWTAHAEAPHRIKSVTSIVRGIPRGRLSAAAQNFFDPKDNEILMGYPFHAGGLFGPATSQYMETPLVVVDAGDGKLTFLSSLDPRVRAKRFYFQPGEKGYRVELVSEKEGWIDEKTFEMPAWRLGRAESLESAARLHYDQLEKSFHLPAWETRPDVPDWLRETALVVSLHGISWHGYIFNDYARMLKILEWVATQIPARRVLAFIAAWDGRYYWNYPLYETEPRMGGDAGYKALIAGGQTLGFKMMPMFGANVAHERHAIFSQVRDARVLQIDGNPFGADYVDWDNDRHSEGGLHYMNLGVDSWRNWMLERISAHIDKFHPDACFMDIAGAWVNNGKADMHDGTRKLVHALRARYPQVVACGEMYYDAQLEFIPLFHVFGQSLYPPSLLKYGRSFQHLSHPAPGRGSSGVHEWGFSKFNPETLSLAEHQIPTLSVVDDTFDKYRDLMTAVIKKAKERTGIT